MPMYIFLEITACSVPYLVLNSSFVKIMVRQIIL